MKPPFAFLLCILFFLSCGKDDNPVGPVGSGVSKSNPTKIYIHYKAFFQSPEVTGYWGKHWTNGILQTGEPGPDGRRAIASYYYPLTGPYDTRDPIIQEYQLLLMKYSGIDGLIFDWYGSHDIDEYSMSRDGANSVINRLSEVGLQFAISYQDSTVRKSGQQLGWTEMEAAKSDMAYINNLYFSTR